MADTTADTEGKDSGANVKDGQATTDTSATGGTRKDAATHLTLPTLDAGENSAVEPILVNEHIPWITKLAFVAPSMSILPFVAMFSLYGNPFYETFGASLSTIALFTALARSLDVVSDPLMSYLTDSMRTRFGRRRPFMFAGAFAYSVTLLMLMRPPYGSSVTVSAWFGVAYILYFLANTLTCIPYFALAPELSRDTNERNILFFLLGVAEGLGTFCAVASPMLAQLQVTARRWNAWVCKPFAEQAELCIAAKSCRQVFAEGVGSAFRHNSSLATALMPLSLVTEPLPNTRGPCSEWLKETGDKVLGNLTTASQNDAFCSCMTTCDDACAVADQRTGFEWVGWCFAGWFLVSMLLLVFHVREKPVTSRVASPPLVPSMLRTIQNGPFRILLPAWAADAFCNAIVQGITPYFVVIVTAPRYQTLEKNGRDCSNPESDTYAGAFCDTPQVIVVAGVCVLLAAVAALPLWKLALAKFGKRKTWLLWSLVGAVTNIFFVFLGPGDVMGLWIVAALNGIPLGAKFIADSILTDTIDYDEFLTAQRNEATYIMFKSFLPKIVQIPAAAIPIALLNPIGYRSPIGGVEQEQDYIVVVYTKIVVLSCFIASLIAFLIKRQYPLHTDDEISDMQVGIVEHRLGRGYPDPVTKLVYKPLDIPEGQEVVFWVLDHFRWQRLHQAFVMGQLIAPSKSTTAEEMERSIIDIPAGTERLANRAFLQFGFSLAGLLACVGILAGTAHLVDDIGLAWLPTVVAVFVGVFLVLVLSSFLRMRASLRLRVLANSGQLTPQLMAKVLAHRQLLAKVGSKRSNSRHIHAEEAAEQDNQEEELPAVAPV